MKEQIIYVADDGERFDDKAKCEVYEADGCVHFEPLPKYGDHSPITDERAVYWALNGDGDGYYATATRMSREEVHRAPHPAWATHIVYFGK